MRVVIFTPDFNWAGGIDLLHGIVKGLLSQTSQECEVFILVHNPLLPIKISNYRRAINFAKTTLHVIKDISSTGTTTRLKRNRTEISQADKEHIQNVEEIFGNEPVRIIQYNNNYFNARDEVLKRIGAHVVLPVLHNRFDAGASVPWVGYLFDFIYKYHSHLYTKEFCLEMDIRYATTLLNANAVIVNSAKSLEDACKFFPYAKAKLFHMPFAPYTNEHVYNAAVSSDDVIRKYSLGRPYFMISNQFWLHKSHETAFEALKLLHGTLRNTDVDILCTGRMSDLSGTNQRELQLRKVILDLGLENSIHFLGHISKVDQLALMLRAVAVVQPTLFEGGPGGGSVYMAVANGIPAIVSDIPVNLEIADEPFVTFFKTSDAGDLANKMAAALSQPREMLPYHVLALKNEQRQKALGDTLVDCINHAIEDKKQVQAHKA